MQNQTRNTGATTARQSGKWAFVQAVLLLIVIGLINYIQSKNKQSAEYMASIKALDRILNSYMESIQTVFSSAEKNGGIIIPIGTIFVYEGLDGDTEVLIASVIRSEAYGWDPDEYVSIRLNKEGQVIIQRIGVESKYLINLAKKNSEKLPPEKFFQCLERYKDNLGPALKRYLKSHLEANNRRHEKSGGGFLL